MRSHATCAGSASLPRLSLSEFSARQKRHCAFGAVAGQRNLQGEMTQAMDGRRGIPAAWKGVIIGLSFYIASTERDPEVGQWEGTGSRLYHYHQYRDERDEAQLRRLEQNSLLNSSPSRRDHMEEDLQHAVVHIPSQ